MVILTTRLFCDDAETFKNQLVAKGIQAEIRHSGTIPCFWWILVPESALLELETNCSL